MTAIWGTTFVAIKQALNDISVTWFLFYRFFFTTFIALFLFFIIKVFFTPNPKITDIKELFSSKGWFLGLLLYGSYFFQTFGLQFSTPANAAFITGLSVILVPIVLIFKGHPIKKEAGFAFLIAFIGLLFLTVNFSNLSINEGDILVLGTAIFLSFQIVYTGEFVKKESALQLTMSQFLSLGILSFLTTFLFGLDEFTPIQNFSESIWFALLLTVVFATIYAFFTQTYSQKTINPVIIAIIFTFEPIFALLTSLWLGQESLTTFRAIGMFLIMLATYIAIISEQKSQKKLQIQN